jgi:hypothetical protein
MLEEYVELLRWNVFGHYILLDVQTGSWRECDEHGRAEHHARGFGVILDGALSAVLTKENELFLFVDQRLICCSPGYDVRVRVEDSRRNKRKVTVESSGHVVWTLEYELPEKLRRAIDPTFDQLDDEMSDFWLWLAGRLADNTWRSNVISGWRDGIKM